MLPSFLHLALAASAVQAYTVIVVDHFMYKNIDPIVMPGKYKSHLHEFFGSDAVNVSTTTSAELQQGCSTAQNPNDFSVYWTPALLADVGGKTVPVKPMRFSAYYIGIEAAEVPIPQNYKTIAGNASATAQAQLNKLAGVQWFCEGDSAPASKETAAFPTSTCSTHLQNLLLFHDCVNVDTLESAYSGTQNWVNGYKAANRCPPNMKRMPQLRFSIRYDLRKVLATGWSRTAPLKLASGNSFSMHGDFINGWVPEAAQNMLKANSKRDFAGVDGPLGKYNAGSICKDKAGDADPNNGTADYATSVQMMKAM
ncbi:hypothetical protein D6D13_10417 [Aureobasidium pullulans]|uniref:DUF1996 domain-containing protein n=1 Tax=Aureobasidium pullulans TaxID=5580 RepID=A0A4S9C0P4_AURPU|nr:hypothetical protein D6D13_10417 [Aureobasidium pullulans]